MTEQKLRSDPLFIVGVPRSGTTLARQLLAGSADCIFPLEETQLGPALWYLYKKTDRKKVSSEARKMIRNSNYAFLLNHRHGLNVKEILDELPYESAAELFKQFIVSTTVALDSPKKGVRKRELNMPLLWGDKTPNYALHIPAMLQMYPKARFLHVVRDPRDVFLSMQAAWGRSVRRAALEWLNTIRKTNELLAAKALNPDNYLQLLYEDILSDPEVAVRGICKFCEITYDPAMLEIQSREEWGRAKGTKGIQRMARRRLVADQTVDCRYVEALCLKEMQRFGYAPSEVPVRQVDNYQPSAGRRLQEWVMDNLRIQRVYIRQYGWVEGIRYRLRQFLLKNAAPKDFKT